MLHKNSSGGPEKCVCSDAQNDNYNVYRYTREEMLNMRDAPLSRVRPQYLSTEFDNDEGKFEPEKWLEYRWICEGVENRPNINIKRKEKLKVEALEGDTTVLSPQRRGFSSGCRAASPMKNEAETERLGATKASWRSGAGFQLKNSGTEYKASFHKNAGSSESSFVRTRQQNGSLTSSAGNWRSGETSFKPNYQKESSQSQRGKSAEMADERMPEWLNDGPTSMHDMIELRGFDDDSKTKRDFSHRPKRQSVRMEQQSEVSGTSELNESLTDEKTDSTDWRLSSQIGSSGLGRSPNGKSTSSRIQNSDDNISTNLGLSFAMAEDSNSMTPVPLLNGSLPNSDAEFAAIMGILGDADLDSLKENELKSPAAKEPTGSRLSRFFATTKSEDSDNSCTSRNEPLQQRHVVPSSSSISDSSQTPASISVLNKIFSSTCQRPFHSQFLPEPHVAPSVQGILRVEDLERNFQKESAPGNPSTLSVGADSYGNVINSEQLPSNSRQSYISQTIKGNPLGDPYQQAHLMNKLNKFARLQNGTTDDVSCMTEDNLTFPSKISVAPTHHLNSQAPSHSVVPPIFSDVTFQAAFLRSQYEKAAALHALAANQRSALVSSAQTVDNTILRQALTNIIGNGAVPQSTQTRPVTAIAPTPRTSTTGVLPNSFMPTSVMRQMTKNSNTSMTTEEKLRHSNIPICSTQYNAVKQNIVPDHFNVPHKLVGDAVVNNMASKSAANLMTRLAVQQQYAQVLAAMQNGLSLNNWQSNAQMTASVRAQALAAHAEHQRQYALAAMRGDLNQAQLIRARFLSQQAAAFAALPNVPVAPHPHHVGAPLTMQPVVTTAPIPMPQNTQAPPSLTQYKYQNPLEKLLQSAGVPANRGLQPPNKESRQGSSLQATTAANDLPSIISRLPPTANCISVEELEKQFAAN
uniref:BMA-IFET-1, isoform i n=2 Tax=Brugia malayi TaxID=6279 RepID=A0A1I9G0D0_BRUMA|nr:BMA-IFET-1, isoform i [Brugia malayi]